MNFVFPRPAHNRAGGQDLRLWPPGVHNLRLAALGSRLGGRHDRTLAEEMRMLLNVVLAKGRIFVDVPVEIELPDDPSLQDLIEILPAAAAAARSSDPTGHFAGLEIAKGVRRDWIVEGRGANGQPWRREAWAVQPGEAALQAVVSLLEETRAVRISDVPALVEVVRRLTVSAVLPEDSAPTP